MEENKLTHRPVWSGRKFSTATPPAERRVTFQTAENGWLTARLERTDGQPLAQSANPIDQKAGPSEGPDPGDPSLLSPHGQKVPWEESDANDFTQVNFDYAAILGYGVTPEGTSFMKALYFLPHRRPPGRSEAPPRRHLASAAGHLLCPPNQSGPRKKVCPVPLSGGADHRGIGIPIRQNRRLLQQPRRPVTARLPRPATGETGFLSCIFFPKFSLEMVAMYAKIRYTIPTTAGERSLSRPREI